VFKFKNSDGFSEIPLTFDKWNDMMFIRMSNQRVKLAKKRAELGLSMREASALIGGSIVISTIKRYEDGEPATGSSLRELCRAYMREAARLGYDPWECHESVLCPGEFPEPVSRDDATLAKILGNGNGSGNGDPETTGTLARVTETETEGAA
jgi:hypothetical protein